jgi:1-acyl-sn-glycerol-3-phosphate acyltransferase
LKYLAKLARVVYTIYALSCFLLIMLLFIPVVIIATFLGRVNGGNIIYDGCRVWADVWLFLIGISHRNIYEAPHNPSNPYIFVCNHISFMDSPVIMKAIRKQHFRVLGKAELGSIPVFGFIFKQAAVSVDRKSPENRAKSVLILKSIIKRKISVFIFPEGTFNETHKPLKDFYNGAFKIAVETQTPVKPIVFLDTYDRLNYKSIFSLSPGRSRAVFLEETATDSLSVTDVPLLKQKIYKQMEEALIRYNASWIR